MYGVLGRKTAGNSEQSFSPPYEAGNGRSLLKTWPRTLQGLVQTVIRRQQTNKTESERTMSKKIKKKAGGKPAFSAISDLE